MQPARGRLVSLSGFIFLPLGVTALVYVDAILLRWLVVVLVLVALAALISGWRYHGKPSCRLRSPPAPSPALAAAPYRSPRRLC